MNLDWTPAFRSWPNVTPKWRDWFRRIASSQRTNWEQYDISQCLNLSLSEMIRNEPMVISASYFWSDALNAFMFNHGPMTPTLMDVVMHTGLNIHAADRPFRLLEKASFKIETKSIGGWKGYIGKNMKTRSMSVREHTTFLNMWLEKFIFCGKAVGPTNNNLKLVENLATGNLFLSVNIFWGQFTTCFIKYHPDSERTSRSPIWEAPGGLFSCGCTCICTKL